MHTNSALLCVASVWCGYGRRHSNIPQRHLLSNLTEPQGGYDTERSFDNGVERPGFCEFSWGTTEPSRHDPVGSVQYTG